MALALPPIGRRVLSFGLQALRRLGLRPTELNSYLSLNAASLKRYVVLRDGDQPERPPRRRLRKEQEEALFLYWWDVIAGRKPLAPVGPGRRLLDAFCPICLHVPTPEDRDAAHGRRPLRSRRPWRRRSPPAGSAARPASGPACKGPRAWRPW